MMVFLVIICYAACCIYYPVMLSVLLMPISLAVHSPCQLPSFWGTFASSLRLGLTPLDSPHCSQHERLHHPPRPPASPFQVYPVCHLF